MDYRHSDNPTPFSKSLLPTAIQELAMENKMLHAENALKLTQILDLEQLLWDVKHRTIAGIPCWCNPHSSYLNHSPVCIKARQATEPFWKNPNS